jgi:NMD protein affecting ribosome stability and mRNA decay
MEPATIATENAKCRFCGREIEVPASSLPEEDALCTRCYEKMLFPETRLKSMEIID